MTVEDAMALLRAFEKRYPFIQAKHFRSRGAALISKIQNERRSGKHLWDVYIQAGLEGFVLLNERYFAAYNSPEREHYPEGHRDRDGFWTTAYTTPMLASYNTNLVTPDKLPKSYFDLLKPEWKGRLGLDPREGEWYANIKKAWGAEKTREFINGLKSQNVGLRVGRSLLTQLLGAGEFAILVNNYFQNVVEAKEKGSPVHWLALDPVILGAGPVGINEKAPHPNAARLFVDFVLSREGQALIVKYGRSSARVDVKDNPADKLTTAKARLVPSDIQLGKHYKEELGEYRRLLGVASK